MGDDVVDRQPLSPDIYPDGAVRLNMGDRLPSFREMDIDGDGVVRLEELKEFIPREQHAAAEEAFRQADKNNDGKLDRSEHTTLRALWQKRVFKFANIIVQPKNRRFQKTGDAIDAPGLSEKEYKAMYSCCPPPVFMFSISIAMIIVFISHTKEIMEKVGPIGINGPPPMDSVLIYNPYKRYEAWRYLTYMFVHAGWVHITSNLAMQLFLGIPLEMVHKCHRVLPVYCLGVIAGSLATSITDPTVYLAGASGGVYALITAHMATVIMNWSEMGLPWVRVIAFTIFVVFDVGIALYYRYVEPVDQRIGYAAHFGGAVIGLLVGIFVLKNIKPTSLEKKIWWASLVLTIVLLVGAIGWNLFYADYFPEPR